MKKLSGFSGSDSDSPYRVLTAEKCQALAFEFVRRVDRSQTFLAAVLDKNGHLLEIALHRKGAVGFARRLALCGRERIDHGGRERIDANEGRFGRRGLLCTALGLFDAAADCGLRTLTARIKIDEDTAHLLGR